MISGIHRHRAAADLARGRGGAGAARHHGVPVRGRLRVRAAEIRAGRSLPCGRSDLLRGHGDCGRQLHGAQEADPGARRAGGKGSRAVGEIGGADMLTIRRCWRSDFRWPRRSASSGWCRFWRSAASALGFWPRAGMRRPVIRRRRRRSSMGLATKILWEGFANAAGFTLLIAPRFRSHRPRRPPRTSRPTQRSPSQHRQDRVSRQWANAAQGPTGPITTGTGGAPAESPQGQTPPGMRPRPGLVKDASGPKYGLYRRSGRALGEAAHSSPHSPRKCLRLLHECPPVE